MIGQVVGWNGQRWPKVRPQFMEQHRREELLCLDASQIMSWDPSRVEITQPLPPRVYSGSHDSDARRG